jgi:BirA family biotin operon repressor/biotin-[acetyl-CoA-carboxylase] ligase
MRQRNASNDQIIVIHPKTASGGASVSRLFQLSGTYHRLPGLSLSKIVNLLPLASVNGRIGLPFLELDTVDSTNNYAMGQLHAGLARHGHAYYAHHQFAGKGQRGKTWNASPGENITISIVIDPVFPNNQFSFLLSASIVLGCIDFLKQYKIDELTIKWPNDIYWRDRKAAGILIENVYRANEWKHAVVGIGMNVNQVAFEGLNAVSMKQITGTHFKPTVLAQQLCERVNDRYQNLFAVVPEEVIAEYNSILYKRNEQVRLKKENAVFETTIKQVTILGNLETSDVVDRNFSFGEVELIG